jgi:nucleotide-binding universal stress UspA family protein
MYESNFLFVDNARAGRFSTSGGNSRGRSDDGSNRRREIATSTVEDVRMRASILCPVDFSDESLASLNQAATIAERSDARLVALHVADPLLVRGVAAAYHTDVVVQENTRALQEAVDQIRRAGAGHLKASVHVVVGDPVIEICQFSNKHHIDLIVMASHQAHGYLRLLFGSVTDGVVHRALTPILVLPPHPSPHASTFCVRLDHTTASHA